MKKLYVIVHELSIDWHNKFDDKYNKQAITVKKYIGKIKKNYQFLEIKNDPYELHPNMPKSSHDLEVIVIGAYIPFCVNEQKNVLKREGYNVRIDEKGCLNYLGADTIVRL